MNALTRNLCGAVLAAALVFTACGDSDAGTAPRTLLAGLVLDGHGDAIADVTIGINGAPSATTSSDGSYAQDADALAGAVISFSKPGYVKTIKRVDLLDGVTSRLDVHMLAEVASVPLDADAGGTVTSSDGITLIAPPGVFVDAAGSTVGGMVDVSLTHLDPSTPEGFDAYPGDMQAETATGETVTLETFGVADVTVRQNGAKLQVKDGMTLTVRVPAPAGVTAPPASVPLWSFDEARALWIEESVATWNAADGVFEGELPHMSPWNLDIPITQLTCISGRVVDAGGAPIAGAQVLAAGVSYLGGAAATTAADGTFCVLAKQNSTVKITAIAFGVPGGRTETIVTTGTAAPSCANAPQLCTQTGDLVVRDTGLPTQDDAECPLSILGLERSLDATGTVTLTPANGGPAKTLSVRASKVYPANLFSAEAIPAACVKAGVRGDASGWMDVSYDILLEDESGTPVLQLQNIAGLLVTRAVGLDGVANASFTHSGELRVEPDPAQCGANFTLVFDQLARSTMPQSAGAASEFTLDGSVTFGLNDRDQSVQTGPFQGFCDIGGDDDTELRNLTSSDTSKLPFGGVCLHASSSIAGGGQLNLRFLAATDPFSRTDWIIGLKLALASDQPQTLTLSQALAGPADTSAGVDAGTFTVFVGNQRDGLEGVDWRVTAGTLDITAITQASIDGTLSVTLSRLGSCGVAPEVTDETVDLTAELRWVDGFSTQ